MQRQQQALDGDHQGKREQDHVNNTVVSAVSHAVDRFSRETERLARDIAVVAPGNGSIGDSSIQCSDVDDDDDDEEETDVKESGWIMNLPVSSTIVQQQPAFATTNGDVVLPNADQPTFGDVRVQKSKNVRLVHQTCYNGPVTLKQYVYTNPTPDQDARRASDNTSDLPTSKDNGAPNGCVFPQNTKLNKVTQWLWTWKRAVLSYVITLILLAIVVPITVHLVTRDPDASTTTPAPTTPFTPTTPTTPEIPDSSTEDNNGTDTTFRIVERDEWGARPPSRPLIKLKLPVPYVIIGRSQGTPSHFCTTQSECTTKVRFIQTWYLENKFWDIGYNFLVGGDGLAYVGTNWDYESAHAAGYNNRSIGISFIGKFSSVVPSKLQLRAARKIIELGVKTGKITPDYKLLDRQVWDMGDTLYNEIIKWPHWSSEP